MRAAWPAAAIERQDFWTDLAQLNKTFVFERALLVSRPAAHQSPLSNLWYKMISGTMDVVPPADFWKPLQQRVIRNAVGYLPALDESGRVTSLPPSRAPVVTYISRQGGVRRLTDAAHEGLVDALRGLEKEGLCDLNVVLMENQTFSTQLEIVARTTVCALVVLA